MPSKSELVLPLTDKNKDSANYKNDNNMDAKELAEHILIMGGALVGEDEYDVHVHVTKLIENHVKEQLYLFGVSQRSELLRVFDSFFEWHKEQGYVSIKRDDFEEYLKTLNCC